MTKFNWEKKVVPTVYYRQSSWEEEAARKRRIREEAEHEAWLSKQTCRWHVKKNNKPGPPKKIYRA